MASRKLRGGSVELSHLSWALGTVAMATNLEDDDGLPLQLVVAVVVDGHGMVIGHGVSAADNPLAGVEDALSQAIGKPANGFGSGALPRRVTVMDQALLPLARRLLPGVAVKAGRSPELEQVLRELPAMAPAPEEKGISGLTTYLENDLTPALVSSFFSACADLYRREPWSLFADDQCLFHITSRSLAMHQWCGCVIGQAGDSHGVLLFESRHDQRRFQQLAQEVADHGKPRSGTLPHQRAISYEPLAMLSPPLVAEIEQHGWPMAPGDSVPVPLHIDPDFMGVPSSRESLAQLEATARALTRLIDNVPDLAEYWHWTGQDPMRRNFRVPVQDRGAVSVSLTLIPPDDDHLEECEQP